MPDLIRAARPAHWVKNSIVLFPVVFALKAGDPRAWWLAGLAAVAFCLASSASYILNDIHDRQRDAMHPSKKNRPIASGRLSLPAAWSLSAAFAGASLAVSAFIHSGVLTLVAAYLLLQAAYTHLLKHKMLLDVIGISLGFVLRAVGGAVAISVAVSPWLFVCTFTLCLFMGFCKRCNEIITIGQPDQAAAHRPTLAGYSPELLTHLITVSAGVAVIAFLLYATSPGTGQKFHSTLLVYTLPLVFYGVFRVAMLSMLGRYSDPIELILRDRPCQLTLLLWMAAAMAVLQWGDDLPKWLSGT
jgi:4-hydroxybenzoate polyprenyltransferase